MIELLSGKTWVVAGRLTGVNRENIAPFMQKHGATHLTKLETLSLYGVKGVTVESTLALLRAPHLAGLRHLELDTHAPWDDALTEALLDTPHLKALEHLELPHQCTEDTLRLLQRASHLTAVTIKHRSR